MLELETELTKAESYLEKISYQFVRQKEGIIMGIDNRRERSLSNEERVAFVQKKQKQSHCQNMMLSISGVLLFFIFWELLALSGIVSKQYLASPVEIIKLFAVKINNPNPDGAVIMVNILSSLKVSFTGFGVAVLIGIPLGWLMGWYRPIDSLVNPIFEIVRPIPPVAWIPLTIVWMGVGLRAKATIVFLSAFIPCVINSYTGIRQTSEVLINVGKTCGASNFTIFCKIGIPSAMTMTFTGLKLAIGNAWSTLVAAEMLAATSGLGYMILQGRNFARTDIIMLGVITIGVIGTIIISLFNCLENFVLGWKKL